MQRKKGKSCLSKVQIRSTSSLAQCQNSNMEPGHFMCIILCFYNFFTATWWYSVTEFVSSLRVRVSSLLVFWLPPTVQIAAGWVTCNSVLPKGKNVSVNGCLSLCVSPMMIYPSLLIQICLESPCGGLEPHLWNHWQLDNIYLTDSGAWLQFLNDEPVSHVFQWSILCHSKCPTDFYVCKMSEGSERTWKFLVWMQGKPGFVLLEQVEVRYFA